MYHMNKFNDDKCCDMRGLLGFLILFLLSKKSMHGQEIAEEIVKRGRRWKTKPRNNLSNSKSLRDSGFLEGQKEGKTIIYNLTRKGKKSSFELAKGKFSRTFLGVLES